MNLFALSGIFIALFCAAEAVLIFLKGKTRTQYIFGVFLLSVMVWGVGGYAIATTLNHDVSIAWWRIAYAGVILIPITLLHFVSSFLDDPKKSRIILLYIIGAVFEYLNFSDGWFIAEARFVFGQFYYILPTIPYTIFVAFFFAAFVYSLFRLWTSYRTATGIARLQLRYLFLGILVAIAGGAFSFLPVYRLDIYPAFNITIALGATIVAYSILRYRLMDIKVVVRRSAVFALLVFLITLVYGLIAYLAGSLFQGVIGTQSLIANGVLTAMLVAIAFEPIKKQLSIATDKFLFKAEYKPEEVIADVSDTLSETLDLTKLASYITRELQTIFKCHNAAFFLSENGGGEFARIAFIGTESVPPVTKIGKELFSKIFSYLKKINAEKEIVVRDEIVRLNESRNSPILDLLIKNLKDNDINLAVPIYLKEKLIGIFFLGDKKSGDGYTSGDLKVLEIIANQSAVAINNAELYQEQKNYAARLKVEVEKATTELRTANKKLRKLDQMKSEFLSIASHQLRAPLTVIRGYISMIKEGSYGKVPQKMLKPLELILDTTVRIIRMVEDLLNLSRIESGGMKYDFTRENLVEIAESVFMELKQQAKSKGLKFQMVKPAEKLPDISIDKDKIREVIMNLTENAIKYTDKGSVTVAVAKVGESVQFSVKDTGRGIAADQMPLLFRKFSRSKEAQASSTKGTGLGLYIAKEIVKKHGGKIWAESEGVSTGSTFYLQFRKPGTGRSMHKAIM